MLITHLNFHSVLLWLQTQPKPDPSGLYNQTLGRTVTSDGVQDTLPSNTAPWRVENFKLKESEKTAELSSPLKKVIKSSCDGCPPYTHRKENLCLPRQRDTKKNLSKQDMLSLPCLLAFLLPLSLSCSSMTVCSSSNPA